MNLYLLCLLAHIIGLTFAAGTTVSAFILNQRFWKFYNTDKARAAILMELGARFPKITGMGIGLLLLSGVFFMSLTKGAFAGQLWFRIKMALVLLVIVNSFVVKTLERRVRATTLKDGSIGNLQQSITVVYLVQLFLFLTIFVLGVFKFT